MTEKKRNKKWKITLSVFLAFVLLLSGLAYWQRENIGALIDSQRYSAEERGEQLAQQEELLLRAFSEQVPGVEIHPLSEEEEKLLREGKLSPDDALQIITGKKPSVSQGEGAQNQQSTQTEESSRLNELIGQIYVLRSSFVGRLNGLVAQAKQEYINGGGSVSKGAILKRYMGIASGLEGQCDGQMESLLSQIKAELEKTGGDLSLIGQIRSTYQGEKRAKKAEILNQF
ncbi:MAG: hypothetical protein IJB80_01150 [Clostridia bacterium]|nr:hypothetical protein [Clostridia bacterium]